ncbi:zinc-ribbon domain-containing protein [Cryobacterium sp. 10S3]
MCHSWNTGVTIAEDFARYFEPENVISVASDPAFHTASGRSTDFGHKRRLDPLAQITPGRVHPVRAFYSQLGWDVSRNGDITTSTRLRDDPIVGWTCHSEHNFALSVSDRLRGFGCGTCWPKGYSILATPFTIAHPLAWRDWDYSANGARTPDRIFPGADESVTYFWLCSSGHRYQNKVRQQARIGSACSCPSWASSPRLGPRSLYYSTRAAGVENGTTLPER